MAQPTPTAGPARRATTRWPPRSRNTPDAVRLRVPRRHVHRPHRRRHADAGERRRRPGPGIASGSIVVVAHRDARARRRTAGLSGTATLIELARDLAGETLNRTVVLASTSGSQGTAGAIRLASTLAGPIDAVIVLGDLASTHVHQPIVVPWSTRQRGGAAGAAQHGRRRAGRADARCALGCTGLGGQFAHLAFPLTISEQGAVRRPGDPRGAAVALGRARPARRRRAQRAAQLTALGRAVLPRSRRWTAARRCRRPRRTCCSTARSCPAGRSRCSCWR